MQEILFDSKSGLDKLPFGAVCEGAEIVFGLRLAEGLGVTALKLVAFADDDGLERDFPLACVWTSGGYARFEGRARFEVPGLYWYHFIAVTENGERPIGKSGVGAAFADGQPELWQQTVYMSDYTTPDWIKGGAIYQIFVDRFFKAGQRRHRQSAVLREDWGGVPNYLPDEQGEVRCDDFFGGDLDGVIAKLPYLQELGVSCIYLNPIFEAESNHKYDTADYMKIDPAFGDEDVFARLCAEAQKRNIRIVCDGVFNHTGSNSIYFNRNGEYGAGGAYQSRDSLYYDWYGFADWPEKYDAWWGIKTLPQIRKNSEDFRDFITGENGVLEKWTALGACGWRLDVVDELSGAFVRALNRTVKRLKPEALILGEVWEDASSKTAYGERKRYFQGGELDGVMNYPLRLAIIDYVVSGRAENLRATQEALCENYPKQALDCCMNILGTHDTVRILTLLGGEEYAQKRDRAQAKLSPEKYLRAKKQLFLAALLQFTLPGVPSIYYGDEAGLEGFEDPFCRGCYPWGNEDAELIDWYKKLLTLRKNTLAFAGGDYRTHASENGVFAFTRSVKRSKVMVAVNLGEETFAAEVTEKDSVLISFGCDIFDNMVSIPHGGCSVIKIC